MIAIIAMYNERQSFAYTQLKDQTVLFLTICINHR